MATSYLYDDGCCDTEHYGGSTDVESCGSGYVPDGFCYRRNHEFAFVDDCPIHTHCLSDCVIDLIDNSAVGFSNR